MPEVTDRPAPIRAKMRFDDFRYRVKDVNSSRDIPRSGSGADVPLNFRFSCFALRAATFLSPALGFFSFWPSLLMFAEYHCVRERVVRISSTKAG
jgi:hypothetical protein